MLAMGNEVRKTDEYKYFNQNVLKSARVLKDSLSEFITRRGKDLNTNILLNQTKDVIAMSLQPMDTFHMIREVRKYDDITFLHSLNVAILSHTFGQWYHMSQEDVDILTLAGLLHDVGKMQIPEEIIKKPGALNKQEIQVIREHPQRGYSILKDIPLDQRIKNAALMHHERCDGSGYPNHLKKDQIDDFSRIIAIVDCYDALTSARLYRGAVCPFEVLRLLQKEDGTGFDSEYLHVFADGIAETYVDSDVILSDGRRARIVGKNAYEPASPQIMLEGRVFNLQDLDTLSIERIV